MTEFSTLTSQFLAGLLFFFFVSNIIFLILGYNMGKRND